MRQCSKPGCPAAASVMLGYNYAARLALLEDAPMGEPSPHLYALCLDCAEGLVPPRGWVLEDRRAKPAMFLAD